jgi:hypothetical protein
MPQMKQRRQNQKTRRERPRLPASVRSKVQDELTEVTRHRAAISEVLRAIAGSPHDLQPIFDTILDSARRLCQAEVGSLRLSEQAGLRRVAVNGNSPYSPPELLEHSGHIGQFAASRSPVHIPDLTAHELYRRGDDPYLLTMVKVWGFRTALYVPMVKDEKIIGVLSVARTRVQPFTDKQIELVTDFAAQAAIALEFTRREREYRQVQNELAHANRIATIGQLTTSIAHELKQPLTGAVTYGSASLRWLVRNPPEIDEAKRSVEQAIKNVMLASDVIDRIHSLLKKHAPRMEKLDINGAILEVVGLIQSESDKEWRHRAAGVGRVPATHSRRSSPTPTSDPQLDDQLHTGDERFGRGRARTACHHRADHIGRCSRRRTGQRSRVLRREHATSVCTFLHDEAQRHGYGPIDLPVDHRGPRRTAVGEPDRPPRCSVSVYDPSHSAGQIMIRSMSLFGTKRTCRGALMMSVDRGKPEVTGGW